MLEFDTFQQLINALAKFFSLLRLQYKYMTCNKSNFEHLKAQERHFFGWPKDYECPTTKQKQPFQNQPFVEDGFFWNVNHLFQHQYQRIGFQQLDPVFEGQILRDHLQVVKVAVYEFMCSSNQESISFLDNPIAPAYEGEIGELKELYRTTFDFVTILKNSSQFKQEDIRNLQAIFIQNPVLLRFFLIFGETAPTSVRNKLYYLIYKGLLIQEDLKKQEPVSNSSLFQFMEKNFTKYLEVNEGEKEEEKYKLLAFTIMYTTALSASGISYNRFYEKVIKKVENLEKLKLTKFERYLNSVKEKSKKVKIVRRSMSRGYNKKEQKDCKVNLSDREC